MCSSNNNWPLLLDLSKDDSKRVLRNLELEAYGSLVSAFRAQGDLDKHKKKLLQDIQHVLSISTERHRSEIRRAVNDEKLSTVADCIAGPDISSEWHVEGRRLVPIMPRLVPQTAFTVTANNIANHQVIRNMNMPKPVETAHKDYTGAAVPLAPMSQSSNTLGTNRMARPSSPTPSSNVLVLPSGMSIHIKEDGQMSTEDEIHMKRQRRSSSAESLTLVRPPSVSMIPPTPSRLPPMSAISTASSRVPIPAVVPQNMAPHISSPMKFSMARSPPKQHSVTTTPSGQKVIIVSSTMTENSTTSVPMATQAGSGYLQRAVSAVPIIKSSMSSAVTTTVNTVMYPRSSVMMSASSLVTGEQAVGRSNIITIATTASAPGPSCTSMTPVYQQAMPSAGMTPRPRVRTITARPRAPYHTARATAVPMNASQSATPSSQSIHIRPSAKPTIHIKQEGSMKIITQGTQGMSAGTVRVSQGTPSMAGRIMQGTPSTAGRILPKPSGSQVLVVTTATPSITMVTKTANAGAGTPTHIQGGKVLNISTSGGRILATSTPRTTGANVVTVNPKTLQLTTVKGPTGAAGGRIANPTGASKPNVIVVQKAQPKKVTVSSTPTVQVARTSTSMASPFEKELVSFLQRQGPGTKDLTQQRSILDRRVGRPVSGDGQMRRHVVVRQKSADGSHVRSVTLPGGSKSSILAGLIQAVGISPENITGLEQGGTPSEDSRAVASITSDDEGSSQPQPNQWVEYDVHGDNSTFISQDGATKVATSEATDVSAIRALLDLQAGSSGNRTIKVHRSRPSSLQLGTIHGEQITLEPIHYEDPDSPEIQIIGTSGLEDGPPTDSTTQQSARNRHNIHSLQKVRVMDEAGNSVQVQISNPDELNQYNVVTSRPSNQQLVGEIDPHTCALYTSSGMEEPSGISHLGDEVAIQVISSEDHKAEQAALLGNQGATKTIILSTTGDKGTTSFPAQSTTTVIDTSALGLVESTPTTTSDRIDFLSSALNQAQIDLDSYQYVEDGIDRVQEVATPVDNGEGQPTLVSILNRPSSGSSAGIGSPVQHNDQRVSQVTTSQGNLPDLLVSTPASTQVVMGNRLVSKASVVHNRIPHVGRARAQFTPMQDLDRKTSGVSTIHVIKSSSASSISNQTTPSSLTNMSTISVGSGVSVASEPSGLDPANMKLEDLSSQQHLDSDLSSEDILVTSSYSDGMLDSAANIRLSKRKRKAPPTPDEIGSPTHGSWVRVAMGLLQKVMRVRGSYKEKGEMNAASWFTQPVNARDVPDYYEVIENPMDFGTIKRKLETSLYLEIDDFHADVLLVRDNCHRYNPPGTDVRRDCDEVFSFYAQEYDRTLGRIQQGYTTSPGKRSRLDRSPIRP